MIEYRQANSGEVDQLLRWAADEGWNPGIDDATIFHAVDLKGFFVALDNDKPVAGLSVVRQGQTTHDFPFAFLGLYICLPEYRGRGIGWNVWEHGMAYAKDCVVGLDGVVEQQDNYRQSGFEFAWRNVRYAGKPLVDSLCSVASLDSQYTVRECEACDMDSVVSFDTRVSGVDRHHYLGQWLVQSPHRKSFVLRQELQDKDAPLCGYGTIRRCLDGHKIGALVAENVEQAELILHTLCTSVQATNVMLDVPEPNAAAVSLAKKIGLEPVFETARMYRGLLPENSLTEQFGVTTLELG